MPTVTRRSTNRAPTLRQRYTGCMLGGAVGDALGAAVEFQSLADIRKKFGPSGIRDFASAYDRVGAITDDTQMTMFTAEGLLRAWVRGCTKGICHPPSVVHHAYLRWLRTQGIAPEIADVDDGWLIGVRDLWAKRAPGNTCIAALRGATALGKPATNDSKGCGGVMRAAPVGLMAQHFGGNASVFELGMETAALTHGHPSGYLSAGFLSVVIAEIVVGHELSVAIEGATDCLVAHRHHEEVLSAVKRALEKAALAQSGADAVKQLGEGWIGEEALAISLYCGLVSNGFMDGVVLAVNHGGDSDSTGSITGNILGALHGIKAIPAHWLDRLELRKEINKLAEDLLGSIKGTLDPESPATWRRYPGW
jgi:ADP-ribosyl-[dinitrogen reductase] hydrolase